MLRTYKTYIALSLLVFFLSCSNQENYKEHEKSHPLLILQQEDVQEIKMALGKYPVLNQSFLEAKAIADKGIESGVVVPVPKDPGGGYSHEKHKQNYIEMYNSSLVYQLGSDEKYAVFVRDMLMEYQRMYPGLPLHPMKKNQAPGKLFWQGLNESVWLVYSIQAYDCIYDFLNEEERRLIEENLFRKMVEFFTVEDSYSFNRVHNHGTWAVAGVGMTGMVLGDTVMINQALYSTKLDGSGGFLKQISELFSIDGYYSEGPYYHRYALMPFMLFAQALDNNQHELNIFAYRDSVLVKAVNTILQLTNNDGKFYPINDAIREKSWLTPEMVFATNIIYSLSGDPSLSAVAIKHGQVMLSRQGLEMSKAISEANVGEFERKSLLIRDGENGKKGGVALMRLGQGENQTSVLFKFSSQGMGHGHYDRLAYILYDKGNEIISDYGSARFLNVEAKEGGRYLKENNSWAKQSVAHNTLVINEESHFKGNLKKAETHQPDLIFADLDNEEIQIVSASDSNAYSGLVMNRTLTFFELEGRRYLTDIFHVKNQKNSDYDFPLYFNGHLLHTNFEYERLKEYRVLGKNNGYQHLIVDAKSALIPQTTTLTWMYDKGFYSLSRITDSDTEFFITRLGANDPDYNLRSQQGLMFRYPDTGNAILLSVFEVHGNYNPASESVMFSSGSVQKLQLTKGDDQRIAIEMELANKKSAELLLDLGFSDSEDNQLMLRGENRVWKGNYKLIIH